MFSNRKNRGSANGGSELTEAQVRAIRQRLAEGSATQGGLARLYGVSANTIGRIWRGETWGWLDEEEGTALAPDSPQMQAQAEESLRRLQALGAGKEATGQGLKRLQEEVAPLEKAGQQLEELIALTKKADK